MSVNTVFDNVTGSITEIEEGADPRVEVTFDPDTSTADFSFFLPPGPQGETGPQGEQGPQGETGAAAGFGAVTATVDNSVGTPNVEVTTSGEDTAKNFAFAFHNLKGATGEPADAHAPHLIAGAADSLLGKSESWQAMQHESGQDGLAVVESVQGNTVVWNQLAKELNNANYTKNYGASTNYSVTFNDGVATVTTVNESTTNSDYIYGISQTSAAPSTKGHIFLETCLFKVNKSIDYVNLWIIANTNAGNLKQSISVSGLSLNTWHRVSAIFSYAASSTEYTHKPQIAMQAATLQAATSFDVKNIMLFDLTAMFGAGNEPSTVAEFEALFPESYYAYDAGSLLSVNIEGMKSVGFNQWDEVWEVGSLDGTGRKVDGNNDTIRSKNYIPCLPNTQYYADKMGAGGIYSIYFYDDNKNFISDQPSKSFTTPANARYMMFRTYVAYGTAYKNDICINLSDPALNGTYEPYTSDERAIPLATYFPTGMKSAGTAHDALYSDHAETVMGAYTFTGSETIYKDNWRPIEGHYACAFALSLLPDRKAVAANVVPNAVMTGVEPTSYTNLYNGTDGFALSVTAVDPTYSLFVRVPSAIASTGSGLLAWLAGKTVIYELATPAVTEIDPLLNMSYPVETGGTESIVIPTGEQSAPPRMAVVYGYTADGLRDEALAVIAPVENGNASTNYAIGSYLVHNGKLCKVTVAIASGEAVEPGNNCTVTTVMAEMVTLTS